VKIGDRNDFEPPQSGKREKEVTRKAKPPKKERSLSLAKGRGNREAVCVKRTKDLTSPRWEKKGDNGSAANGGEVQGDTSDL